MKGAALSTTLLDPLQRPGACNWTALAMRTRETRYDVQTTLDAQETTCFKQDKMEIRFGGGDTEPPWAVVLRTVLQNCRGVPFKGPGSLGGSCLKGPSKNRGVQGGRGAAGGR